MRHWSKVLSAITLTACLSLVSSVSAQAAPAADAAAQAPENVAVPSITQGAVGSQPDQAAAAQADTAQADAAQAAASTPNTAAEAAEKPAPAEAAVLTEPALAAATHTGAPRVRLVEEHGAQLTLHIREGTEWKPICQAPCSFEAPLDPADFALSGPDMLASGPRVAAKKLWLAPGDGLQAKYKRRKRVRSAGATLAGASLLMFLGSFFIPFPNTGATLGSIGAAFALGTGLAFIPDRYSVKRCAGCGLPR